ncbi:MAG TPA: hypothetical protein VEQ58_22085 [Polyangiaceae bacterium]|nr:hypothetical protein [Polyangiaceae bacterium]
MSSRLSWGFLLALSAGCGSGETATDGNVSDPPPCAPVIEDATLPLDEPPDGSAACAAGDCNYQTQEGCSAEQSCRPQFNATEPEVHPGCEPAGSAERGEPCATQADCARGLYCALDACRTLCCGGDWTACDAGESCIRALDVRAGGEVLPAGASLCFPVNTCDPLAPDSCADEPDRECKIVDPTGAVACSPRSTAQLGDPCSPSAACSAGLSCVGDRCTKLCAAEACAEPACSAAEGSCVHFARDPAGVGECTLGR